MNHKTLLLSVVVFTVVTSVRARDVNDPGQHWTASVQAETNAKYADALTEVLAYEQQGGDPFMAAERFAWLSFLAADYAKAEQAYARARQLQPAAINPLLGLLSVAMGQKDGKKIERAAEDILRAEPTNYRAQSALAALHFANKDYRRSASDYHRLLTSYPDDADAMSGEAWSAFYLGLRRESYDAFRRLLSISPSYPYAQQGFDLIVGKKTESTLGVAQ
jgi:tetratricopeptide (TPR) repeat protein